MNDILRVLKMLQIKKFFPLFFQKFCQLFTKTCTAKYFFYVKINYFTKIRASLVFKSLSKLS